MSKTKLVSPPKQKDYPRSKLPIKKEKLEDILKIIQNIPGDHPEFYNEVYRSGLKLPMKVETATLRKT